MLPRLFILGAFSLLIPTIAEECSVDDAQNMIDSFKAEAAANPNDKCDAFCRLTNCAKNTWNAGGKTFDEVLEGCDKSKADYKAVAKKRDAIKDQLCNGLCNQGGSQATEDGSFCPTTTMTPWDSSASSSAEQDSLDSSYSGFFQNDMSDDSSNSGTSSGSTASGSSGSYMQIWQWIAVLSLLTLCCCAAIASAMSSKPKPKKKKKPVPVPEPEPEEPMPELSPLIVAEPMATSFMAAPMYPPVTTAYTTAMAPPMYQSYAMPATYAMQAPMATSGYVV
jgi:hypothetical protein